MKEQDVKLTLQETEQLCRLYIDCQLTVLEETELQYVLERLPYSSPCIDEVRMLMGVSIPPAVSKKSGKTFSFLRSNAAISIAASFAILFSVGIFLQRRQPGDSASDSHDNVYIAAYNHGKRLKGDEALQATNMAMEKADSLMAYACHAELYYMMKAENIITATITD